MEATAPRHEPVSVTVDSLVASYDSTPVLDDVSFEVRPAEIVSLLGPSGCGKTTLLRCLAGLERPRSGKICIGDRTVAAPGVEVPPEQRRIGLVFQDGALFPHLTVARNVAFGLPRAERRSRRVDELLELVGLGGMGDRLPGTLSGGQQQRVALARALAPRPSVLLLDEPFSSLDASLRVQVRTEVHRLLVEVGVTAVFVTHDQDEAFVMGDRVAVLRDGRIEQFDEPATLYDRPCSPWLASFVGEANLVPGTAEGPWAETVLGSVRLHDPADGPVVVLCRPEQLKLRAGGEARVDLVEYYGHDTRYLVRLPDGTALAARDTGGRLYRRGDEVGVNYIGEATTAWPSR